LYTIALPEGIVEGDVPYLSAETVGLDCGTVPTAPVGEEPFVAAMQELTIASGDTPLLAHLEQQSAFHYQAVRALFWLDKFKVHWKLRLVDLAYPNTVRQIRLGLSYLALDLVLCPSNTRLSVYLVVASEQANDISAILEAPAIEQEDEDERRLYALLRQWRFHSNINTPRHSERRSAVGFPGSYATLNSRLTLTLVLG